MLATIQAGLAARLGLLKNEFRWDPGMFWDCTELWGVSLYDYNGILSIILNHVP